MKKLVKLLRKAAKKTDLSKRSLYIIMALLALVVLIVVVVSLTVNGKRGKEKATPFQGGAASCTRGALFVGFNDKNVVTNLIGSNYTDLTVREKTYKLSQPFSLKFNASSAQKYTNCLGKVTNVSSTTDILSTLNGWASAVISTPGTSQTSTNSQSSTTTTTTTTTSGTCPYDATTDLDQNKAYASYIWAAAAANAQPGWTCPNSYTSGDTQYNWAFTDNHCRNAPLGTTTSFNKANVWNWPCEMAANANQTTCILTNKNLTTDFPGMSFLNQSYLHQEQGKTNVFTCPQGYVRTGCNWNMGNVAVGITGVGNATGYYQCWGNTQDLSVRYPNTSNLAYGSSSANKNNNGQTANDIMFGNCNGNIQNISSYKTWANWNWSPIQKPNKSFDPGDSTMLSLRDTSGKLSSPLLLYSGAINNGPDFGSGAYRDIRNSSQPKYTGDWGCRAGYKSTGCAEWDQAGNHYATTCALDLASQTSVDNAPWNTDSWQWFSPGELAWLPAFTYSSSSGSDPLTKRNDEHTVWMIRTAAGHTLQSIMPWSTDAETNKGDSDINKSGGQAICDKRLGVVDYSIWEYLVGNQWDGGSFTEGSPNVRITKALPIEGSLVQTNFQNTISRAANYDKNTERLPQVRQTCGGDKGQYTLNARNLPSNIDWGTNVVAGKVTTGWLFNPVCKDTECYWGNTNEQGAYAKPKWQIKSLAREGLGYGSNTVNGYGCSGDKSNFYLSINQTDNAGEGMTEKDGTDGGLANAASCQNAFRNSDNFSGVYGFKTSKLYNVLEAVRSGFYDTKSRPYIYLRFSECSSGSANYLCVDTSNSPHGAGHPYYACNKYQDGGKYWDRPQVTHLVVKKWEDVFCDPNALFLLIPSDISSYN
jgi:hypothetical protein